MNSEYSKFSDLDAEIRANNNKIPLAWVSSWLDGMPFGNFGDALSPVVLGALTGLPCVKRAFNSKMLRVASAGTIGHEMQNATVHIWGSGVDSRRNVVDQSIANFVRPPATAFNVHAVRGPLSRRAYEQAGIFTPKIFGDPGCFLPRIVRPEVETKYDLGIIVHISELKKPSLECHVRDDIIRYDTIDPKAVRLISTYHEPSWPGFLGKLEEILSCRRILSSSFHGVIVPEAYGIPSLHLHGANSGGINYVDLSKASYDFIDHRIADYYSGQGTALLPVYSTRPGERLDWEKAIDDIDIYWEPPDIALGPIFHSCPIATIVNLQEPFWGISQSIIDSIVW